MIALLLLRVFHDTSPVSEKILRMYSKAVEDFLPSEHPNNKYSMIYTNNLVWNILKDEDEELFGHLKEHLKQYVSELEEFEPPSEWNKPFGGIFKKGRQEMPMGLPLIKGWLDTGFLGWLPEFGVIFIWDQFSLLGGSPSQNQRFIVRLCVQLLKHHRQLLLDNSELHVTALRKSGRAMRSKVSFYFILLYSIHFITNFPFW